MPNITLIVDPKTPPLKWKKALKEAGPFTIFLDGAVEGPPAWDPIKVVENFNHHEGVDRNVTLCTAAQVVKALRMKLLKRFRDKNGQIKMIIKVNDCDHDTCLSVFALRNYHLVINPINPRLNRLVSVENELDSTSGAYPFPKDLPFLRQLAWVFEPYTSAQANGLLSSKDPVEYRRIIDDCCNRIMRHIMGEGEELDLDTRYTVLGGGIEWKMVQEIGNYAKMGMYSDEIEAFVSVRPRKDGVTWDYSIGKESKYIDFDILKIFKELNERENATVDRWGGNEIIGGSPRVAGSKLSPKEVEEIVNTIISKEKHAN